VSIRLTVFFVVFSFQSLFSQIDNAFLKHLSDNNLKIEYFYYLQNAVSSNDTLDFYYSKYHFQFGDDSSFLVHAARAKNLLKQDTSLLIHYSKHFLKKETHQSNEWFNTILDTSLRLNDQLKQLHLVYNLTQYPLETVELPLQLQKDYQLYYRASKKKPIVAGLFSAIVPGTGLLYLNKPRAFASNLAIVGGFGYQTYESSRIFGWQHPLTIINAAFFSGFYLVNVIGSYLEVKKNLRERQKQYLIHASTYYADTYPSSLY
jgi:hypothetical protein